MSSGVEAMMREFLTLDKNMTGSVDKKELEDYYAKHKHPKQEIDGWMKKFDANKDNKITIDEFCSVLGVEPKEMKNLQKQILDEEAGKVVAIDKEIKIVASTMSMINQKTITDKFKALIDSNKDTSDVASEMREFLQKEFNPIWQCVIVEGSYWMHFIHEPFNSIQFEYKGKICLAWRTPKS